MNPNATLNKRVNASFFLLGILRPAVAFPAPGGESWNVGHVDHPDDVERAAKHAALKTITSYILGEIDDDIEQEPEPTFSPLVPRSMIPTPSVIDPRANLIPAFDTSITIEAIGGEVHLIIGNALSVGITVEQARLLASALGETDVIDKAEKQGKERY